MMSPPCPRVQSPTSKQRIDEKNTLKSLNDRLACYIERALYLKNENSRLKLEGPQSGDTILYDQFKSIKGEFERELDALNDSARKYATESETLKGELCALKCRLESAKNERIKAENDVRALCQQLEKEKIDQVREREELCKNIKANVGQIQGELHIGYETKLQKLLNNLRSKFKDKVCIAGVDIIKNIIPAHGNDGSNLSIDVDGDKVGIESEIEGNVKIISELQGKLTECTTKKNNLQITVDRHQREHGKNMENIRRMQHELVALLNQYQDLIDIKLLLDFELSAYNQMLAIEEYRFDIADMCSDIPASKSNPTKRRDSDANDTEAKRQK